MEKLLEQAQDLVTNLNKEVAEARNKNAEANQLAAKLRIDRNAFDSKVLDLEKRERSLEEGEAPVKAEENAKRIKTENVSLGSKIHDERDQLEKDKQSFRKEINREKLAIQLDKEENNSVKANLKKVAAELKEEKENMKANLIKELQSKL